MRKWWFSKINLEADLPTEERGWPSPTGKRRDGPCSPSRPPPAPGVAKAAALAEVKSSGTVEVFLRQWGEARVIWNWCGEVTGFYTDLCFRTTEEAKTKARQNRSPMPRMSQVPGNSLGEKRLAWGPRGAARTPVNDLGSSTWVV